MTQETKWTRGPWQKNYGRRHSPDECDIEIVGDIFVLANINGPNYAHCEANADLIAAAPEMAEAARKALNYIENTESELGITLDSGNALRAVLQKAGG